MATWEDSKGTRWVLTPFWGPVHPDFKVPVSYGPVRHGAVVAFKVEEKNGKLQLTPAWMSRDMDQAEPPVIANGVVFAYGSGENTTQSYPDRGLNDSSPLRIGPPLTRLYMRWMPKPGRNCIRAEIRLHRSRISAGLVGGQRARVSGDFDSVLYCFGLAGR